MKEKAENVNTPSKPRSPKFVRIKERSVIVGKFMGRSSFFKVFVIVLALNFAFAILYSILEDIPFHLALYWATDTLTNTGTGLVPPTHDYTWYLTTFLMWIGLGVTLMFVQKVWVAFFKKEKTVMKMENIILLIGWTEKIRYFITHLPGLGVHHNYVLIADLEERPHELPSIVVFIKGTPDQERILRRAGIENATQAIIAIENDAKALLVAMTCQTLNPKMNLSVNLVYEENIKYLERIGVQQIICDEVLAGNQMIEAFHLNKTTTPTD
ncbi:MAG: NAD-binding protein [Promethearchaeota archaeon]